MSTGDRNKGLLSRTSAPLRQPLPAPPDLGLHGAVTRADIGSICYALLGGQPIDALRDGLQPIHLAAMQDDPAVIEILLQNGADANARTMPPGDDRHPEATPRADRKSTRKLHQRGLRSRSSFSFLKYSGVGPISAPIGFTTGLHSMQAARNLVDDMAAGYACQLSPESVDLYCEYHSATPLHFAIAGAHVACVEALLRSGACVDAVDSYGNTPASVAAVCGHPDVAALVCGGRPDSAADAALESAAGLSISAPATQQGVSQSFHGLAPLRCGSECTSAVDMCQAQQLPSPNPSDRSLPGMSPNATALSPDPALITLSDAAASLTILRPSSESLLSRNDPSMCEDSPLIRRHTAGEADAYLHYGRTPTSPASSWVMVKHRDASPIGMRSLSISYTERRCSTDRRLAPGSDRSADEGFLIPTEDHCGRQEHTVHGPVPAQRPATAGSRPGDSRELELQKSPLDLLQCGSRRVSRNVSTGSRRERSYTDSVIERAWRSYVYHGDEQARESAERMAAADAAAGDDFKPMPESWMWQQAAIAVRYRRSQSLSTTTSKCNM
ncbi:hypothetical protein H4S02_003943 [Coemansia sp. RSA 2611]|nr:hypothetical protein H4S02_003943 [Coemansia sp. RSA 2611]